MRLLFIRIIYRIIFISHIRNFGLFGVEVLQITGNLMILSRFSNEKADLKGLLCQSVRNFSHTKNSLPQVLSIWTLISMLQLHSVGLIKLLVS